MVTQSLPHSAPPVIPPALPAGTPSIPSSSSAAPTSSDTSIASGANTLTAKRLLDEAQEVSLAITAPMARMPVSLQVTVPVRDFRVRQLLAMAAGEVIESQWANGEDLPLSSGDVQLAWTEFEVVDSRIAVRITRLA